MGQRPRDLFTPPPKALSCSHPTGPGSSSLNTSTLKPDPHFSSLALQNHPALDALAAEKGGTCATPEEKYCFVFFFCQWSGIVTDKINHIREYIAKKKKMMGKSRTPPIFPLPTIRILHLYSVGTTNNVY